MQASTSGKPVWPDCQAASRSAETSCSRRPSAARSMLCHSIAGEAQIAAAEDARRLQPLHGRRPAPTRASRHERRRSLHPRFPEPVPAVPRGEPPDDTGLRPFDELDARVAGPLPHATIAGIGHARARLLVGHQQVEASLHPQSFQHGDRLTSPRDQPNADSPQRMLEVAQALPLKLRVTRIPLGLPEHLGLVKEHGEHSAASPAGHRFGERGMISDPQVTLQPYTHRINRTHRDATEISPLVTTHAGNCRHRPGWSGARKQTGERRSLARGSASGRQPTSATPQTGVS